MSHVLPNGALRRAAEKKRQQSKMGCLSDKQPETWRGESNRNDGAYNATRCEWLDGKHWLRGLGRGAWETRLSAVGSETYTISHSRSISAFHGHDIASSLIGWEAQSCTNPLKEFTACEIQSKLVYRCKEGQERPWP
jgi:hypothetical protein